MKLCVLFSIVFCNVAIIVAGGFIFQALSDTQEWTDQQQRFNKTELDILRQRDTDAAIAMVVRAYESGSLGKYGRHGNSHGPWTYRKAIFYSVTIATTVGYGDLVPLTKYAKNITTLYALLSIPMTIALIATLGRKLYWGCVAIDRALEESGYCCEFNRCRFMVKLRLLVAAAVTVVFIIVLHAALFLYMEAWHYCDALYFTVITMTTVGLGDYTISHEDRTEAQQTAYVVFVIVWIYASLVCVGAFLTGLKELYFAYEEKDRQDKDNTNFVREEEFMANNNTFDIGGEFRDSYVEYRKEEDLKPAKGILKNKPEPAVAVIDI